MSKKMEDIALVIRQEMIANDIYSMCLKTKVAREAKPGQFISLYCKNDAKLLPRPISICEIDKDAESIRIVYRIAGEGTKEFSTLKSGDTIRILGPLGNGFVLEGKNPIIIGGGIGVPPMLQLAKAFTQKKKENEESVEKITAILGYRTESFLMERFDEVATVYAASDDGSIGTKGTVIDAMNANQVTGDVIYACGPKPMLAAVKAYAIEHNIKCYVSMEEKMACGIGACLGCVCKTKGIDEHSHVHNARVCKDGPVFLAEEVEL